MGQRYQKRPEPGEARRRARGRPAARYSGLMPASGPPPAPKRYVLRRAAPAKSYRIDYYRELNAEQQAVVFAPDGPTVVVAGAGSGKTRTLVYRVSRLVEDGVAPEALLLLTFTNRAAKEMTRRVEGLLGADLARMTAGTFHSVGARLLRPHAELLGYRPNFSILDSEDSKDLLESATSDLGIPITERRFPKGDLLRAIVSFAANTGRRSTTIVGRDYPHLLSQLEAVRAVIRRYLERKVLANAMDYDDLLLNWKRLLETHPEVRKALAARFRSVLVDEFQDVNHLQAEIVDLLAKDSEQRNVMVVGDDAQSIYSFRGADAEALLGFPDRYPGATIYRLETNYRSTPEILKLADASIAHNARRYEKTLVATRESGVPVAVVGARDLAQQAEFVAQRVLELRDEGTPLSEIGVLYRAHFQALELQIELTRRGIPYEVRSGLRFFEQAHVKDVLAAPAPPREPEGRDVVQAGAEAPAEGGGADGGRPLGSGLRVARAARRLPRPRAGKAPAGARGGRSCASARR